LCRYEEVANATLIVHWGRQDKDPEQTTAYPSHAWATKTSKPEGCPVRYAALLAGHARRCYRPGQDIVVPPWRVPGAFAHSPIVRAEAQATAAHKAKLAEIRQKSVRNGDGGGGGGGAGGGGRDGAGRGGGGEGGGGGEVMNGVAAAAAQASALAAAVDRTGPFFLFRGDIRMDSYTHSLGVRQEAYRFYGPNKTGSAAGDVIVDGPALTYREELASATFCGVFPGDGWSARYEDAVLNGCIPVIVQDSVHVAWEGYLDVGALSVRFRRLDIATMVTKLRQIPRDQVLALRRAGARVWHRMAWLGYFAAERNRARAGLSRVSDDDARNLEALAEIQGADAMETLMTVLRHKLMLRDGPGAKNNYMKGSDSGGGGGKGGGGGGGGGGGVPARGGGGASASGRGQAAVGGPGSGRRGLYRRQRQQQRQQLQQQQQQQ
jgi:uncharacterized membrane protein YgcG